MVDVNLEKLAIFAIRVGVDAKRAANILRRSSEVALKAIKERGETFAMNFIKAACTSNRRIWEHSLSVLGMLALKLVHEMNLENSRVCGVYEGLGSCSGNSSDIKKKRLQF